MFDKGGRKRLNIEYLLPNGIPYEAVIIGQSPLLGEYIAEGQELIKERVVAGYSATRDFLGDAMGEEKIPSMRYLTLSSCKDNTRLEELIDNKAILFLCINTLENERLLAEITSVAGKMGTWTVGIVPSSSLSQIMPYIPSGVDNIISFNHHSIENKNAQVTSKIIKALWHGCIGKGLVCMDASDVQDFLALGKVGYAGVAAEHGKNNLEVALRKVICDLEITFQPDLLKIRGIYVSVEAGHEAMYQSIIDTLRSSFTKIGGHALALGNIYDNSRLTDSVIVTVICMI